MARGYFLCFLLLVSLAATSQTLYRPRDINKAYIKGIRSETGMPGKNYWQNHGRYTISITAQPPDRTIKGTEQITYINNSPDTLRNLVFKLILNSHRPDAIRYGPSGPDYITSGVHIDQLSINGSNVEW